MTLLRGTVAHNIGYGLDPNKEDPDLIRHVAMLCGLACDDHLPNGLETKIDEKGRNLPGGLRARIALARAIVASPRLLLIDDFAFVADPHARNALQSILAEYKTTVLMVGSEDRDCLDPDQVWCLKRGKIEIQDLRVKAGISAVPLKSVK